VTDTSATAVAERDPEPEASFPPLEVYDRPAESEIEQWARDLSQAYAVAARLVTTSFVPDSYHGRASEAAAAIMTGQELGLSPIASLRSIDIIQGVPAMRAVAMRALAQSRGHDMWVHESTATRCVVRGRRKGSDQVQESVWTTDRARGLNLLNKANWKNQPIAMLIARATSELARLIAADVFLGVPYSIEELEDMYAAPAATEDAKPKRTTSKAQRAPVGAGEPEIVPTTPPAAEQSDHSAPEPDQVDASDRAAVLGGPVPDSDEAIAAAAKARAAAEFADAPELVVPPVDMEEPEAKA
jgi:hypothetical protein